MNRVPAPALRVPLHAEGTVTRGTRLARTSFRVVLASESRGVLDLTCALGERLTADLRVGEELLLALELDRSVLAVEARVVARTGSTLRVSFSGELSEQPRRRRHTRVRVNQATTIRIEREDGRLLAMPARIIDVSPGGCSVRLEVVVVAGARVTVDAELSLPLTLTGVVRAGGGTTGTIGVRFDGLRADVQAAVLQYVHDHARRRVG